MIYMSSKHETEVKLEMRRKAFEKLEHWLKLLEKESEPDQYSVLAYNYCGIIVGIAYLSETLGLITSEESQGWINKAWNAKKGDNNDE